MVTLAPIVLFVYNRPIHTEKTISALQENELASESDLFIYSDAAKDDSALDSVNEVRNLIDSISGFKKVTIIRQEKNLGLATSIISGVTEIVNKYGRIIVLEDDLVTSPYFLRFMNDSLNAYQDDLDVGCIHGYIYPICTMKNNFFIKGADCWGWATWDRAWSFFEPDGEKLLEQAEQNGYLKDPFNIECGYVDMLKKQISGQNDSWAIRWYFSSLIKKLYCLYPAVSFVNNIGLDSSGTHCDSTNVYLTRLSTSYYFEKDRVTEDLYAKEQIIIFFQKQKSLLHRVSLRIKRLFK